MVWKLKQSKKVEKIFCAPGNPGMEPLAKCVNIKATSTKALAEFALRNKINLTVVGPEAPLAQGIADEFQKHKLKLFGPERAGAQIESSKVFAKEFMRRHHIPTAAFKVFTEPLEAISFCKALEYPAVIKADGLASGKGVIVVKSTEQAQATVNDIMVNKIFGKAGEKIIIESFLRGQEVSIMAMTDSKTIVPLLSCQDHKQAYDGDRGPNTGGMGAYCPTIFTTDEIMEQIQEHILNRALAGFQTDRIKYKGVLYAGLMLTDQGPKVLEFNCRFGDPEAQAVLPLLKTDFAELLLATANEKLASVGRLAWHRGSSACVIMASRGYPGNYSTGATISGLDGRLDQNTYIFHSGTQFKDNKWLTAGGRVLGVVARDKDLQSALGRTYRTVSKIKFDGAMYRKDIGYRAAKPVAV